MIIDLLDLQGADDLLFCLGLQNKKNLIKETILNEKINLLCMQETEINKASLAESWNMF